MKYLNPSEAVHSSTYGDSFLKIEPVVPDYEAMYYMTTWELTWSPSNGPYHDVYLTVTSRVTAGLSVVPHYDLIDTDDLK